MEVQISRVHSGEQNAQEFFSKAYGIHSGKRLTSSVGAKNTREAIGLGLKKKILDSQELVMQRWNKILQVLCVMALSLDPLFCYLLIIDNANKCLRLDTTLGTIAVLLRSIVDFVYIFHIIFQFRASNVAHSFQASRQGESVTETRARARKYLLLYLLVDVLIILPLPQVLVLVVLPKLNNPRVFNAAKPLKFIFCFQYVLRVFRMCSLLNVTLRASSILAESAWANLSLFMLAGHVLGAFWYLFSIERIAICWQSTCRRHASAYCSLYCDDTLGAASSRTFLDDYCSPESAHFDFGIYSVALESRLVDSADFIQRISYCFWWGLQNLSSLGQSLKTSTYIWEIFFSGFVSISGLVLLAYLVGNLQKYLLSKVARSKEMRLKEQEIELWMYFHSLPRNLKARIWQSMKHKLKENIRIDVENFLHLLPVDLSKDIKRHLCLGPLREVPILENIDERLLDAICKHLTPVLYTKNSVIVEGGEPLAEMLFVTRGKLLTYTSSTSATATATATASVRFLGKGDFYGVEQLFDWVLIDCAALSNFPLSTKTVKAQTTVEVFVLRAQQLKTVVSKFWWLFTKELRRQSNMSSFSVEQWQPRAASVLQAAWRRYKREKLQKSPRMTINLHAVSESSIA